MAYSDERSESIAYVGKQLIVSHSIVSDCAGFSTNHSAFVDSIFNANGAGGTSSVVTMIDRTTTLFDVFIETDRDLVITAAGERTGHVPAVPSRMGIFRAYAAELQKGGIALAHLGQESGNPGGAICQATGGLLQAPAAQVIAPLPITSFDYSIQGI